jgi:glycerol-3-phosphate dehydrogenase
LRPAVDCKTHRRGNRLLALPIAHKLESRLGPEATRVIEAIEARPELAEVVCECEQVTRAELEYVLGSSAPVPVHTISDIGRRTRLGFGPCQGTFCGYKAMLAAYQTHRWSASQAAAELSDYLDERRKGQSFIHRGKQLEQLDLNCDLYDADRPVGALPGEHNAK